MGMLLILNTSAEGVYIETFILRLWLQEEYRLIYINQFIYYGGISINWVTIFCDTDLRSLGQIGTR